MRSYFEVLPYINIVRTWYKGVYGIEKTKQKSKIVEEHGWCHGYERRGNQQWGQVHSLGNPILIL